MLSKTPKKSSKETKRSVSIEEIIAFLFELVKDNMAQLKNPRFSFYQYMDLKLNLPQPVPATTSSDPIFANSAPVIQDQTQSPTSTPKFVSSEDNTQTKTNYYTEPSIGILIIFRIKLNNRYVITSTKKEQRT